MGERSQWTKEELVILGEAEPESSPKEPESQGTETDKVAATETEQIPAKKEGEGEEPTPELDALLDEAEPETKPEVDELEIEPEDGKVPYSRFSKVYGRSKELERKIDLLRRDPEAYYKLYPEEKPATGTQSDEHREAAPVIGLDNLDTLVVRDGPYDGLTLGDVKQRDPAVAAQLENAYLKANLPQLIKGQISEVMKSSQQEEEQSRLLDESNKEIQTFRETRAKEFFGKSVDKLSEFEAKKIDKLAETVISWGNKNKRGGGIMEDIYFLMTRDKALAKAKASGADALIDSVTKGGKVRSIKTGGGGEGKGEGFDRFLDLTPAQLEKEFENMPDAKFDKLMREGSQELRTKYPGWPWVTK